jgi:long-subunit acyl-CoA synthetase (AMP-forming)
VEEIGKKPASGNIFNQAMVQYQKEDLVLLLYTSGSTSTPRGLC